MSVVGKLGLLLNLSSGSGKSFKDLSDVGAWLHRDDTKLILFVDPHKESFVVVVEDSACFGPIAFEAATLKIFVTTLEKEVIGNKLLFISFCHVAEGVVLACKFTCEVLEHTNNFGFDFQSLLTSACGTEWVISKVTSNTDSGGVDHLVFVSWEVWAFKLGVIHV